MKSDRAVYRRMQVGYWTILFVGLAIVAAAALMAVYEFNLIGFATLVLLAVCLVLFVTLTVTVYADRAEIRFGPGLIRRRFLFADIVSCRTVRNHWYSGWGVRLIAGGWLYNVSGLDAVELVTRSGRRYRIGTDAPDDLAKAIGKYLK